MTPRIHMTAGRRSAATTQPARLLTVGETTSGNSDEHLLPEQTRALAAAAALVRSTPMSASAQRNLLAHIRALVINGHVTHEPRLLRYTAEHADHPIRFERARPAHVAEASRCHPSLLPVDLDRGRHRHGRRGRSPDACSPTPIPD